MKKAMFGGSLLTAAISLTGCMGGAGAATSDLGWVSAGVEVRTDVFLDHGRLIAASELGESTTAIPVNVDIDGLTMTATRIGTNEIVAQWEAIDTTGEELVGVTPVDGELNPAETGPISLPRPGGEGFGRPSGGGGVIPFDPEEHPGLVIDWSDGGGIPNDIDVTEFHGVEAAHPGCA